VGGRSDSLKAKPGGRTGQSPLRARVRQRLSRLRQFATGQGPWTLASGAGASMISDIRSPATDPVAGSPLAHMQDDASGPNPYDCASAAGPRQSDS
jgi:hypothetical protein